MDTFKSLMEQKMMKEEILKQAEELATAAPQEQQQPTPVPFGPVPMTWNLSQVQSSNGSLVVITVQTPQGNNIFFLDPNLAKQLAEAISKMSTMASTGLIIPQ